MSSNIDKVDYAVTIPTVVGSTLSAIGAGFILVCYAIFPQKKHFRHALIINLALTDFLNALNNSISGYYVAAKGKLPPPGAACTANGLVGQLTVQATDISILAIAIVTLLVLREHIHLPDHKVLPRLFIVISVWLLPIATSFTALALNLYVPVTGNWCWLKEEPKYLRYVFTHGWRFIVFFTATGTYIYIYFSLQRTYNRLKYYPSRSTVADNRRTFDSETQENLGDRTWYNDESSDSDSEPNVKKSTSSSEGVLHREYASTAGETQLSNQNRTIRQSEARVKRTLLLNAYPYGYIILWIPGILNRIVEASGHKVRALAIAQASTQFVGLANAITYGVNECVWRQLKDHFMKKRNNRIPMKN